MRNALPPAPAPARGAGPALLLACGNALRQDDGVGLRIAEAVEVLTPALPLRVVTAQQFTPEMAAELMQVDLAIFVDASAADEPGAIRVIPLVSAAACSKTPDTHQLDPAALLALAASIGGHAPARAFAVTIGASQFGYGGDLSRPLRQAVPKAVRLVKNLVDAFCEANSPIQESPNSTETSDVTPAESAAAAIPAARNTAEAAGPAAAVRPMAGRPQTGSLAAARCPAAADIAGAHPA